MNTLNTDNTKTTGKAALSILRVRDAQSKGKEALCFMFVQHKAGEVNAQKGKEAFCMGFAPSA